MKMVRAITTTRVSPKELPYERWYALVKSCGFEPTDVLSLTFNEDGTVTAEVVEAYDFED